MYLYLASSPVYRSLYLGKLGCTIEPFGRRSTYLTGCPPGLTPSHDIEFDGLWETTATTREELFAQEDELHNAFLPFRLMRETPGDSEWFNFQGKNPYEEVKRFLSTRSWIKHEVKLTDLSPPKRPSRYLRKQHLKNLQFIKQRSTRNATLDAIQAPVITSLTQFIEDPQQLAGYVIAPCGSGKTIMTAKSLHSIQKLIVCCPSKQIQIQWFNALVSEGVFAASAIDFVGDAGTTDPDQIKSLLHKSSYCILSTYMSSHLLVDCLTEQTSLAIFDEAHHMAGIVAKDDRGEGRTRRLMMKAAELGIKRLSLTYTPRFIVNEGTLPSAAEFLTMDDAEIFGKKIAELKIRDLIRQGVLPDYRVWSLRDEARKGAGILGKAECILEAWRATEIHRSDTGEKVERHVLHHLIVFAATTQEARDIEVFLRANTIDTLVLRVQEGDALQKPICDFTEAPRAILVNCFVLNEGVDIPIANAVAITYPKQSRGQITQMILRAGRWYEGKSVFHVLIPTLEEEDLSGFEEVLSALASCDEQIRDEIVLRCSPPQPLAPPGNPPFTPSTEPFNKPPECIMIDEFEANQEAIRRCFTNIRKRLFPSKESRRIQELCIEKGIDTSVEYSLLRQMIPELTEDPLPKGVLWYDYLHPTRSDRISVQEFVRTVLEPSNLRVGHMYDEWRGVQPSDTIARLPSVQHITDGFFGKDDTNFTTICQTYSTSKSAGRGGRGR